MNTQLQSLVISGTISFLVSFLVFYFLALYYPVVAVYALTFYISLLAGYWIAATYAAYKHTSRYG